MRKLLVLIVILTLLPALCVAEEGEKKTLMIFPFKVMEDGKRVGYRLDYAAVLGAELSREGDVRIVDDRQFRSLIQKERIDPARMARFVRRVGLYAVLWGTISSLRDGHSLEVSVMRQSGGEKPQLFSIAGGNREELLSKMPDLAAQIGRKILDRPRIGKITVDGNRQIEQDAIINRIEMKPGMPFRKSAIGDDIRNVYSMGYFEDVQIKAQEADEGKVDVRIVVKERPWIKEIAIEGNKVFTDNQIVDTLTTKSKAVVSTAKIRQDIQKIKKMYEKESYYQPEIDFEVQELSRSQAKLVFNIKEGVKSYLSEIIFDGRSRMPEKELKKILPIKEKSWFWLLDDSGTFTRETLELSRQIILGYYQDKGYIRVQVGAPEIDIKDAKVKVTFPIREGDRFQVRKVEVIGDLRKPPEKLKEVLQTKPKKWFRASLVGKDIKALLRIYNNLGYAYADVEPIQRVNDEYDFVDLTYRITQGIKVKIDRVDITGNDHTRDKVMRRHLMVSEGDVYSADRLEGSKKALEGMDFFEAVQIKTSPGSRPDLMNIEVQVIEKKTGKISAGMGYSSQDGAVGNVNLNERNLLGLAVKGDITGNVSARRTTYQGSMTYPWLFDYPLSGTVTAYNNQSQEEGRFARMTEGFGAYLGYPLYGFWSLSTGVARDSSKMLAFEPTFGRSVLDYYQSYGTHAARFMNTSENSVAVNLTRDVRIGSIIPVGGSKVSFGARFSGFGGDVSFSRYFGEVTYYHPLVWKSILKARANWQMLVESGDDPIPFDRRILLGGTSSIRGYQFGQIGPVDKYGSIIGGDRALFANVECLVPLPFLERMNINVVGFFDAGNAWNAADNPFTDEVKMGFGVGVRWLSPMGPLRLDYGWKVIPEKGRPRGVFGFAMGQLF